MGITITDSAEEYTSVIGAKKSSEIGPNITYSVHINNQGFIDADGLEFTFEYPAKFYNGKDLLYLKSKTIEQSVGVSDVKVIVKCQNADPNGGELINPSGFLDGKSREKRADKDENKCQTYEGQIQQDVVCGDECGHKCQKMLCKIPILPMKSVIKVNFQFAMVAKTIMEDFDDVTNINLQTITKLSSNNAYTKLRQNAKERRFQTNIDHQPDKELQKKTQRIWWLLFGALLAILLITILICICYKCGWLQKNRRQHQQYTVNDVEQRNMGTRKQLKSDAADYLTERVGSVGEPNQDPQETDVFIEK